MRNTRLLFKSLLMMLLVASLATFTSCKKTPAPTPPEPIPAKYTIKGTVVNQQNNQPLSGVAVTMGSLTTTTNASGVFEFKDLTTAGKYTLTFKKSDFFDAIYSLEFQQSAPNHTITYNISVGMVPYVPGVTPISFETGGTIAISGATPASLTIPPGTTVKDANNNTVTGTINITAVVTPDIVVGEVNNPGLSVLRFEPSGLQFSKPLPIKVDNPLSNNQFTDIQLEYYNESQSRWEVQSQAVTYNAADNKYLTEITHFSIYKIAYRTTRTSLGATEENLDVIDTPIENKTLTATTVNKIKVKRKSGYIFAVPVETVLANAGVTGTDVQKLKNAVNEMIKPYFGNTAALSTFNEVQEDISVSRTIQPNYKLVTTGRQAIDRNNFRIRIKNSAGVTKELNFEIHSAGAVALFFQDISLDDHGHGSGGGGSL